MRVACVQLDVRYGDFRGNADAILSAARDLAAQGTELAVFPECALTGYMAANAEEARALVPPADIVDALNRDLHALPMISVYGTLHTASDELQNIAVIIAPDLPAPMAYAKTHLPDLGADRFTTPGDALTVFALSRPATGQRFHLGVLICYDLRFPEAARTLALAGADILALPTNWPLGAEFSADSIAFVRAVENRVGLISANRVGTERGANFFGRSRIIAPDGRELACADDQPGTWTAEIDLGLARQKRIEIPASGYAIDIFLDRNPAAYRV
ncbi:MAG: carbon-nitrogen hydrolase family protein [Fimbriimonadaceae bacterium]|nr:carbon-nitrogen hydrolase family protein [Fimbriimonadaceae bacterium]